MEGRNVTYQVWLNSRWLASEVMQGCPTLWHPWATLEEEELRHVITKTFHHVLIKFTVLCGAEFKAIRRMQVGHPWAFFPTTSHYSLWNWVGYQMFVE